METVWSIYVHLKWDFEWKWGNVIVIALSNPKTFMVSLIHSTVQYSTKLVQECDKLHETYSFVRRKFT